MQPEFSPKLPRLTIYVLITVVVSHLALFYLLSKDSAREGSLEKIEQSGVLRVLTRNTSTTSFEYHDQPSGPEYDLARAFADHLGLRVELIVKESIPELINALVAGEGELVAAAITRKEEQEADYRFGRDYQMIQQQLIYGDDIDGLDSPRDLVGRRVAVISGSSYEETLRQLKLSYPDIVWTANGH